MVSVKKSKTLSKVSKIERILGNMDGANLTKYLLETAMLFAVAIDQKDISFESSTSDDIAHTFLAASIEVAKRIDEHRQPLKETIH